MNNYIVKIKLDELQPHPMNGEIYSEQPQIEEDYLMKSLNDFGQLDPLVVNNDYTIISGHRRYYSMKRLGWDECNVRVCFYENDIIPLIEMNKQRKKTTKDILNEEKILRIEYKTLNLQGKRTDLEKDGKKFSSVQEIADRLGIGLSQLKKLKSIKNYDPLLLDKIDNKEISIGKAYDIVRETYFTKKSDYSDHKKKRFSSELKELIDKYQPDREHLIESLKEIYPFSMMELVVKSDRKLEKMREELLNELISLENLDFDNDIVLNLDKKQRGFWFDWLDRRHNINGENTEKQKFRHLFKYLGINQKDFVWKTIKS